VIEFLVGLWMLYPRAACVIAVAFYVLAGWGIVKALRRDNRRRYGE
jgi:hypothetical protein